MVKANIYCEVMTGEKYHSDIYNNEKTYFEQYGISCECTGGGRIDHDKGRKMILVYGSSLEYNRGDHKMAVGLLKDYLPDYVSIRYTKRRLLMRREEHKNMPQRNTKMFISLLATKYQPSTPKF